MRVWRPLLVVLVLLTCCALLASSFEVAKKKTEKAKKATTASKPTTSATAASSSPDLTTATISPEGGVTVDSEAAGAIPAAGTTASATTAPAAPAGKAKAKASRPAASVASSPPPSEVASEAVPALSGPLVLPLEHDLTGDGSWTERGAVEVTFGTSGGQRAAVKLSEVTLSAAEQQQLLKLAASNGYYRIRSRPSEADTAATGVLASVRACALVASALHENLVLHFDIHGTLLSIASSTPIAVCPASPPASLPSTQFTSRGKLSFGRTAERPQNIRVRPQPGEAGVAAPDGSGAGGEAKGEEQSFFMKYWMYIVPFGLFMLLQAFMGAGDKGPEGGAQQAAAR